MNKRFVFFLPLLVGATLAYGQRLGTLKGRVTGNESDKLVGASVAAGEMRMVTDDDGFFSIELAPGVYRLQISHVGFETKVLPEVEIIGGRASTIEVSMSPSVLALPAVEVIDKVPTVNPGKRVITQEQINRLAATYYDPARLVTSSADVAVTNDQNNRVSVRGIPATYNQWRLEGAEVVNPNHLTNAGTLTDQPAGTGGGVNALSAQMLSRSQFLYAGLTPEYGNAVAGLFDLKLDAGDTTDIDFFGQASFIGFDFGAGGPIGRKGASFRANYRYSFTGLLTSMGVDFGGEEIAFQDLSAALSIPLKTGDLKVFAVGGLSRNDFTHKPFEEREEEKDASDIFYNGALGIAGLSYSGSILGRGRVLSTLAYSISDQEREEFVFDSLEMQAGGNQSEAEMEIISNHTELTFGDLRVGWDLSFYDISNRFSGQPVSGQAPDWQVGNYTLLRPFISYTVRLGERWELTPTLSAYVSDEYESEWEPRVALAYRLYPGTFRFTSGLFTQLIGPTNLVDSEDRFAVRLDADFPLTRVWKTSLSFDGFVASLNSDYYIELFYYDFQNIIFDELRPGFRGPPGNYDMRGVTAHWERNFDNDFYISSGVTGFFWDGIRNDQLNFHAAGGVRKALDKDDKRRNLNINLRLTGADQFWSDGYQYDYFRLDLRVQWVRFKSKLTESWALDIQNVLNTQNQFSVDVNGEPTYQLGFLPILAYRLDF